MKNTKEWFESLDEKYKTKALKNMTRSEDLHSTLAGAISNGFVWKDTPEGHDFWNSVFRELMYGEKFINPKKNVESEPIVEKSNTNEKKIKM